MATIPKILVGLLLFFAISLPITEALISEKPTAYEMLEKFNFPKGILPLGVQSYVLNQDGSFVLFLSSDCEFKLEGGYQLKYQQKITGRVVEGSLSNLNGVSVKVLFAWLNINSVVRKEGGLSFYVGPLSASFGLSNFYECPQCGCGFDCGGNGLSADS